MRFLSGVFGRTNGLLLLAAAMLILPEAGRGAGFDFDANGSAFVTGQALVSFKQGTSLITMKSILAKYGADPSSIQFITPQEAQVNFDSRKDVLSFCQQILASGWAVGASPNHLYFCTATPNDPYYATYQWGLQPQGATVGANFSTAWNYVSTYNSLRAGTKVAVLDTGLDLRNPDFGVSTNNASFVPFTVGLYQAMTFTNATPFNKAQLDPPTTGFGPLVPWDDVGHGTHVSGIIAAKTGDSVGVAGGAGASIIYPVKVLDRSGAGTEANIALGIRFAATNGCRVINMSLGGSPGTNSFALTNAVQFAQTQTVDRTVSPNTTFKGCVCVAAMGNTGDGTVNEPAYIPGVVAVGASGPSGACTVYSCFGPHITLIAPGGDGGAAFGGATNNSGQIFSTYPRYLVSIGPPVIPKPTMTNHSYMSGTSMATPHVAAAAALLLQKKPYLSQAQVWAQLAMFTTHIAPISLFTNSLGATSQLPDSAFDFNNGYGRLEASLLVQGKQPALGATTGTSHVFPCKPRNQETYPANLGIPTTDSTQFTPTSTPLIDPVFAGSNNTFRIIVVDDQGELLQSAQVTANFSILYYTPMQPGVYPSGYPGSNINSVVLFDDGVLAHNDLLAKDGVYGNQVFFDGTYSNCILQVQYSIKSAIANNGAHLKDNTNRVVNFKIQ
jgi:subtilisin family serine protease